MKHEAKEGRVTTERALSEMVARQFQNRAEEVARRLRTIADEVEREANRTRNRVGVPEHGWKASQIIHSISWGSANLDLSGLVTAASEADAAEREEGADP